MKAVKKGFQTSPVLLKMVSYWSSCGTIMLVNFLTRRDLDSLPPPLGQARDLDGERGGRGARSRLVKNLTNFKVP